MVLRRMKEAQKQMWVYWLKATRQNWDVDPKRLAIRLKVVLFQPGLRSDDGRMARLAVTAELLEREIPLSSYNELSEDELRALVLFVQNVPEDILQEVRDAYHDWQMPTPEYVQ